MSEVTDKATNNSDSIKWIEVLGKHLSKKDHLFGVVRPKIPIKSAF